MSLTEPVEFAENHSDHDHHPLCGRLRWDESAPKRIAQANDWSDDAPGWRAWRKHLAKRSRHRSLRRLLKRHQLPELPRTEQDDLPTALLAWLDESAVAPFTATHALEALAWAGELPRLAKHTPAELWWRTLDSLLRLSESAAEQPTVDDPLAWHLLAGELPLVLAYLFPEIENCRHGQARGCQQLAAGMAELLDGEGLPNVRHLHLLRPLLACWSRSRSIFKALGGTAWPEASEREFDAAIVHVLRLMRRDGSQTLAAVPDRHDGIKWLADAARLGDNRATQRLVASLLKTKKNKPPAPKRSPPAAMHSEWAELGLLRTDWSRSAARLTIGYGQRRILAELDTGKELLASGEWKTELRFNGQLLVPQTDWEEVCWESDHEADYLELEITFAHGLRLQRQMLLARRDDIFVTADAVLGVEPGEIDYRSVLPLAADVRFEPADETREGRLVGRKPRALVLPLALPEWRAEARGGTLHSVADGLELRQTASGTRALFAPLFFDLRPRRFSRRITWRRLTVAEERQNQPQDVAAGFRVQIGDEQWLVYRSLQPGLSRTVLGHHLYSQYLVGRFTPQGTVEPLMEIE